MGSLAYVGGSEAVMDLDKMQFGGLVAWVPPELGVLGPRGAVAAALCGEAAVAAKRAADEEQLLDAFDF